jgi:hypothetical protein
METNYRFINDAEPSDTELETIMQDAHKSAMENAKIAKLNLKKMFDEYFEKTKFKYAKLVFDSDSET